MASCAGSARTEATNRFPPGTVVWARVRKLADPNDLNSATALSLWWPARVAYLHEVENASPDPELSLSLHRYVPVVFFGEDGKWV